jgi:hypothetical protein
VWDALSPLPVSDPLPSVEPLTAEEVERAISVAKEYLKGDLDIEREYGVSRRGDGYSVYVEYTVRDNEGRACGLFGGHCLIRISSDWKVTDFIGGA